MTLDLLGGKTRVTLMLRDPQNPAGMHIALKASKRTKSPWFFLAFFFFLTLFPPPLPSTQGKVWVIHVPAVSQNPPPRFPLPCSPSPARTPHQLLLLLLGTIPMEQGDLEDSSQQDKPKERRQHGMVLRRTEVAICPSAKLGEDQEEEPRPQRQRQNHAGQVQDNPSEIHPQKTGIKAGMCPKEKVYGCSKCGKSFNWKNKLSRQLRTHTGECPYKCSEYWSSFSDHSNLISHQKLHRGENPMSAWTVGSASARAPASWPTTGSTQGKNPMSASAVGNALPGGKTSPCTRASTLGRDPTPARIAGKVSGGAPTSSDLHTGERP